MKIFALILSIMALATLSHKATAQTAVLANNKFAIELTKTKLEMAPGGSENISILIGRGKKYVGEEIEFVVNNVPDGITLNFENSVTTGDKNAVTISSSPDAKPGTYMVVIYGRIDQSRKGVALAVKVN